MGIWGTHLYENDLALDVREEFIGLLSKGKSARAISDKLMNDYSSLIDAPEEALFFWLSLADTQWDLGVLLPDVKEKALASISQQNAHGRISRTTAEILPENELNDLKAKILSPQPPAKKPRKKYVYICQWKIGDVFAVQMKSPLAEEKGLAGCYFLVRKVDETVWHPGHIVPIVYVKLTKEPRIPQNTEEYDRLEYVQTWFTRYEERFWPIDMSRLKEDLEEKSKLQYERDEYGFLPQYRAVLLNTSKKVIPDDLIYVGNYHDAQGPAKEFIPHEKINITSVSWSQGGETFETDMIKRYCRYNLRESSVFRNKYC